MKIITLFITMIAAISISAAPRAPWEMMPFPPRAGQPGSTAIHKDDSRFIGWADGYTNFIAGTGCADMWKTPEKALGKAFGDAYDIVCIGDAGQITLTFSQPIINGEGFDFAVFENGFTSFSDGNDWLELAWVEVSSDGIHFCRFPNYSATPNPIPNYGSLDTRNIYGLASKYCQGYGHPFDLSELQEAYDAITIKDGVIISKPAFFTHEYAQSLADNFPYLDLNNVGYVKLIDIVGDGSAKDTAGTVIYDPYPTLGSPGFDLDAIGVLHQMPLNGTLQTIHFPEIPNYKLSTESITLNAASDSGLPVKYSIRSGPAVVTNNALTFTGAGIIMVQADQPGDEMFAPASPVIRSFTVAEKVQHIYFAPVPNQISGGGNLQLQTTANSGLPVDVEVYSGPVSVMVDTNTLVLTIGNETGSVRLRATQSGDETYAPAAEVFVDFKIVAAGASNAPLTFVQWCATNGIPTDMRLDSDGDGVSNFQEFMNGTNPNSSSDFSEFTMMPAANVYGEPVFQFRYRIHRRALGRVELQHCGGLLNPDSWHNAAPEIISTVNSGDCTELTVQVPADSAAGFFRLLFWE
ncbi:MAG: hypothetical protein WC959_04985 [Kiritimatiellales bacterium]